MDCDLDKLRSGAEATFAPGHGHWITIGDEQVPAMSVTKRDMLCLLDRLESVEEKLASIRATTD